MVDGHVGSGGFRVALEERMEITFDPMRTFGAVSVSVWVAVGEVDEGG